MEWSGVERDGVGRGGLGGVGWGGGGRGEEGRSEIMNFCWEVLKFMEKASDYSWEVCNS